MKKINNILVPFDRTEVSKKALVYAINYCKSEFDKNIFIINVQKDDLDNAADIQSYVREIADSCPAFRGKIYFEFAKGDLIPNVLSAQERLGADVIMMGTNNQGRVDREDGSNTSKLVLAADCPVIVIPISAGDFNLKKIILVIDRHEIEDKNALGVLLAVAQRFDSKVQVLTIFSDEKEFETDIDDDKIEDLLEYNLGSFYESHAFKKSDDLIHAILDFAKEKEMDLLAILPRNHSSKGRPSEGRLTKLLTLKTDIPLLTID